VTVRWTEPAISDLVQLREFIEYDNPRAAARTARRIIQAVESVAEFPSSGRTGRLPGTRELVIGRTPFSSSTESVMMRWRCYVCSTRRGRGLRAERRAR
jgi:plasmid stabilization system protein ParE